MGNTVPTLGRAFSPLSFAYQTRAVGPGWYGMRRWRGLNRALAPADMECAVGAVRPAPFSSPSPACAVSRRALTLALNSGPKARPHTSPGQRPGFSRTKNLRAESPIHCRRMVYRGISSATPRLATHSGIPP